VTVQHTTPAVAEPDKYDSLADMWSDWYRSYIDAEFPRLIIRFEDTLFHAEKIMEIISKCVGAPMEIQYQYHTAKSKKGPSSDFPTGTYSAVSARRILLDDFFTFARSPHFSVFTYITPPQL